MRRRTEREVKLIRFLENKKIATMQELKHALATDVSMTVHRVLKKQACLTSYSHNGKYYALKNTAKFDDQGLWMCGEIGFSKYGTLLQTLERLVSKSNSGYLAQELADLLKVGVKESLLRLVQRGRIDRERVFRAFLYCATNSTIKRRQLAVRQAENPDLLFGIGFEPDQVSDEVKAAIILFTALLNEKQRRLFAGIEALQFGKNAENWIAHLLGIHPQTVIKGKKELLDGSVNTDRVRRTGAGRPRTEKKIRKSTKNSRS